MIKKTNLNKKEKVARYALSLVGVTAAFILRITIVHFVGPGLPTYITFYPFIMFVAIFGGLGPGFLVTIVSAISIDYWLLLPLGILKFGNAADAVGLVFFVVMGVLISAVVDYYRRNQKKSMEAIRLANSYNRTLIEASLDPLVTISAEGKITDVNQSTSDVIGLSREELIGTDFSGYFTEPEKAREGYRQVFDKGFVSDYPLTIRHKDGKIIHVLYNASVYKDVNGNILGVFAAARNVTESNRLMRELKETKNLLDNILESSTKYSIIGKDLNYSIVSWNEGARRNYGYTAEEIMGKNSNILHTPEDIDSGAVDKTLKVAYEKGIAEAEFERVRKNGSRFIASVVVTRRNDNSGRPIGYLLISNDISEKKRAEEQVRQASQYARSLIEASLDPLVTISVNGKITDVNEATIKATGLFRENLIGTDFSDYFTEPQKAQAGYRQVFAKGFVTDYPLTIRHKDGRLMDVLYNATVYKDIQGNVLGVFAAARDVTAQKQASQYARSLIEASLDPLVTISADGKITDVNEATIKATGLSREKLIGTDFSNYFTEPQKAQAGYRQVFARGFVTDYPLTIRHKDGRLMDVLYNATVYKDNRGNVSGVFAAARDVTAQKQSAQYARSLIEASLDPLVTISAEGKITDVNEATIKATGLSRGELIDTDFSNYFTEPQKAQAGYRQVFAKGFVTDYPLTIRHKDGKLMDVLYNATIYKDTRGNVLGVFAAARDVTVQKQASQYARSLIEASLDPLVTISADGKITDVNEATIKATGLSREKLIGTDFSNYFTEPQKAQAGYRQVFARGFVTDYPLTIRHKDGRLMDVLYNATVYKDNRGNVLGVFAAARDVTAQKKAELELKRHRDNLELLVKERTFDLEESNSKLARSNENLEQFAYVASHDLQEPLRIMSSYSQLLERRYKNTLDKDADEFISFIVEAAGRMQRLITDLLAYSRLRHTELPMTVIDCNKLLSRVIDSMSLTIKEANAGVTYDKLPLVNGHEVNLMQLFQNLIGNALKFHSNEPPRVHISAKKTGGGWLFSVKDNGIGIELQYHDRIFMIFQRLHRKDEYAGTGIGLAICKKIVENHGGRIWVESDLNKGSTFHFTILTEEVKNG